MKHILRISNRIFSSLFVCLLLLCSSGVFAKTVYLKPGVWATGNERFAVYCFGSGDAWYNMTVITDACGGPIYSANIGSASYTTYIFCRMNGSTSANNWDNRWNQTKDLGTADTYYTITGWDSDESGKSSSTQSKAPFQVCVSGTWLRFTGETITLTASCVGATSYQWYKNGTAISGATTSTYTKNNCTIDDGATYTCSAWITSANKTTSAGYNVKIPYLEYRTPPSGSITTIPFTRTSTSATTATCTTYPGVAWGYEYSITDCEGSHGNSGAMDRSNCSGWNMDIANSTWCHWNTDKEGTYTFRITFNPSSFTYYNVTVDYPAMAQVGGRPIYMEKTAAMEIAGWNNMFYRIGKGKYNNGDGRNYVKAYQMELVPGTARYYETETPNWDHDFWAWHIGNNCGDQFDGYSIYQTHSSEYEITQSINFSGDQVPDGGWTIYPHTGGGYGTDWLNDNCIFNGYDHTPGMLQHDVAIAATTNGKIKVDYTHYDNTDHTTEAYTARNLTGLAHTCILTITGVPDCGYRVKTLKAGTTDVASGSTYILDTDGKTITATFELDTYTITYHTNGGTINSGNVPSYQHLTGATLPSDVTRTDYTFLGWYDNSGLTGSPVTEILASDCGNKEYWAKWQANLVFDNGVQPGSPVAPGSGNHLWSNPANWRPGRDAIPTENQNVRIIAECHVDIPNAHANNVSVNTGNDGTEDFNGSLTILPDGGLTVCAELNKVTYSPSPSAPTALTSSDLTIQSNAFGNGALVYRNASLPVNATVQFYSRGENALEASPVWQYMGIPFQASQTAIAMYYAAWMCRWSTASDGSLGGLWQWVENEDILQPFEGYCITQAAQKTYTFTGALNTPVTRNLSLNQRDLDGFAFAANSWVAPIRVQDFQDADFVNTEKTIYIFHTGTYADWTTNGTPINATTGVASLSGQYAAIPIHSAPYLTGADKEIPSMQGFFVQTDPSKTATLSLVYDRVVYDGTNYATSTPYTRAPQRQTEAEVPEVMVLTVVGETYADRVHLLARTDFSDAYEDGWDGRKQEGDAGAPMLAVVKEGGEMAVAAIPSLDERYLSFRAGQDENYTFSFLYEGEPVYLYDRLTEQATLIKTGNTYSFVATNTTASQRFLITTNPPHKTTTDIEDVDQSTNSKPEKFIHEGKLLIFYGDAVYDARGTHIERGKEGGQ